MTEDNSSFPGRDGSPSRPQTVSGPNGVPTLQTTTSSQFADPLPKRKSLLHDPPHWVPATAPFFLTVNCEPRGQNHLAIQSTATQLIRTIAHRMLQGQWNPELVMFMPDHLHAIIKFQPGFPMKKTTQSWKRFASGSLGIAWQRDFFDHRLRHFGSYNEKWRYILNNPVRAGLAEKVEDWPYVWTGEQIADIAAAMGTSAVCAGESATS